ncbi:type I secretion system permease/ATPase, partial [Huaxiibacter chinensis]
LARALLTSPTILLLDEPTAWLDEVSEKQFIQHLKGWLGEQRTLVVATHRLPILELVDRIIVLENGKVVMDGPRDAILNQHGMAPQQAAQRTVTMKKNAPGTRPVEEGTA